MRLVLLGSGTGSNAEALLRTWATGNLGKAEPVAVFSDRPEAPILAKAKAYGVEARWIDPGPSKALLKGEGEQRMIAGIQETGAELIVLAGYMRILKEGILNAFPMRIINLHPSLLPSFKGLDGIGQAYRYGVKVTGCTVHWVTGELDGGPIIDQSVVRIEEGDSLEAVAAKVHAAEHQLLPEVVRRIAEKGFGE